MPFHDVFIQPSYFGKCIAQKQYQQMKGRKVEAASLERHLQVCLMSVQSIWSTFHFTELLHLIKHRE